MSHGNEITDALAGGTIPPPYKASSFKNQHGKHIVRMQFNSPSELESFFIHELIGSDMMEGSASKVIGTTLLIWDRK